MLEHFWTVKGRVFGHLLFEEVVRQNVLPQVAVDELLVNLVNPGYEVHQDVVGNLADGQGSVVSVCRAVVAWVNVRQAGLRPARTLGEVDVEARGVAAMFGIIGTQNATRGRG